MSVGFLHPGAMGAALASSCTSRCLWVGKGRSDATRARARDADMAEVASLGDMAEQADVVVSVCPPAAALEQAELVASTGFSGIYVDANAISPATARKIGAKFDRFVDGGIIGPPPREPGTTRLYLAGSDAASIAELWPNGPLDVRVLDGAPSSASAVKTCFAAWTKGTAALLLAIRALATAEGIEEALLDEWAVSIPHLADQCDLTAFGNGPKAWRFIGEMDEIAAAFEARDLPDGFATAAAEIYQRMADLKDSPGPSLERVLTAIRKTNDS